MRKLLIGVLFIFAAGSLFASPCGDPYIMVSGIAGELTGPCHDGIDFISARIAGNTLNVTKRLDKASPHLYLACATGSHIQKLTMNLFTLSPKYEKYEFTDLIVASVAQTASPAAEVVVFNFSGFQKTAAGGAAAASPEARGRELNIMGTAQPTRVTIAVFAAQGAPEQAASLWETSIRSGGGGSSSIVLTGRTPPRITPQLAPQPFGRPAPTQGCIELRSGGAVVARYVFQGVVPAQGGNMRIDKLQIQIPPGPTCSWLAGQSGWNMKDNAKC
jgi:hypothetical protein